MVPNAPPVVDFVRRDGRVVDHELLTTDIPLVLPLDLDSLDGYSAAARRSQLVDLLYQCARRSVARHEALRSLPVLHPIAAAAPLARRVQVGLAGILCLLVSLEVAPHAGCGTACWAAEALGTLYAGVTGVLLLDGGLEAGAGYLSAICRPAEWRRLPQLLPPALLRQLLLLGVALGGLLWHPYVLLLAAFDVLPALPRCRALLRPLAKATVPVFALAALAAALATPAVAAARAAGAVGECTACLLYTSPSPRDS